MSTQTDTSAATVAKGVADRLREYIAGNDQDAIETWVANYGEPVENYAPSALDWAADVLDVKRTYMNDGELSSVELLVGFGGPNVWTTFNGQGCEIKATWWSEPAYEWVSCEEFSTEMLDAFDNWTISDK